MTETQNSNSSKTNNNVTSLSQKNTTAVTTSTVAQTQDNKPSIAEQTKAAEAKKTAKKKTGNKKTAPKKSKKTMTSKVKKTANTKRQNTTQKEDVMTKTTRAANDQMEQFTQQAYQGFEQMSSFGKEMFDAMMECTSHYTAGTQELAKQGLQYSQEATENAVTSMKELMMCRSLNEFTEKQSKFAQRAPRAPCAIL